MISQPEAMQQIVRLSVLRYRPDDISEAVRTFQQYAANPSHASRMTDWIMRRFAEFPMPVEIVQAAEETSAYEERVKRDRKCRGCDGTGYEQVWQLITYHKTPGGGCYKTADTITNAETAADLRRLCDGKNQILYDCARPCTVCAFGAAIAAGPRGDNPKKEKPTGLQKADLRKHASGDDT